jgi:hypothetical protein
MGKLFGQVPEELIVNVTGEENGETDDVAIHVK